MKPIISVEGLGKKYVIRHEGQTPYKSLREEMFQLPKKLLKRQENKEEFWALKDVSFDIMPGDRVGIIGRNGAGKSTLLKLLSRITEPSAGRITMRGRVASLLEVGTGFHPELTGRENIYLNGAILGMTRAEVRRKFDEIVEFSGVEKFLDTPVKRYSSGMYVRLAFSVAAHLESDILIVDEVLAVGDADFQKKCLGKMEAVSDSGGRVVLFVSHNMIAISRICDKAVYLSQGCLVSYGNKSDVIGVYSSDCVEKSSGEVVWRGCQRPSCEFLTLDSVSVVGSSNQVCSVFNRFESITVNIKYTVLCELRGMRIEVHLKTVDMLTIFSTVDEGTRDNRLVGGQYEASIVIPGNTFNSIDYYIWVQFAIPNKMILIKGEPYLKFSCVTPVESNQSLTQKFPGVVAPLISWSTVRKVS